MPLAGLPARNRGIHHHTRTAHNDLHAALAGGTLHPPTSAVACQSGCHHGPGAVKGRCALMSARSTLRADPLTAPGPRWPGEIRSPGASKELSPTSRQQEAGMEWTEHRGFWLISWPELEQDVLELGWRYAVWRWSGGGPDVSWPA